MEANHTAKMKWIEDVRNRPSIAEVPEKANEQHYEVPIHCTFCPYYLADWKFYLGLHGVYSFYTWSLREIFLMSVPHGPRDTCRSRNSYVRELLCEGTVEGWA